MRADELIGWLRDYAAGRIDSRLIDERRCIPPHVVLDFGRRGVLGLQAPCDAGGLQLGHRDTMRVVEQLAAIDLSLATFVVNHNVLGLGPIDRHGSPALRDELLPDLAQGRALAAFAVTEAGAGSNPQALETTATATPTGGWRLRGTKLWSGSAAWAAVVNVFAKVGAADGRPRGITGFAVRAETPGLRLGAEALTLGMRGMVQNAVHLDDAAVGPDAVLGAVGGGMQVAQEAMTHTRLAIAAKSLGAMKRSLQIMHRYAGRRTVATGLLLDNPVTLARLSTVASATDALSALVGTMCARLDAGRPPPLEAYIACKTAGPELLWETVDGMVQLLGARGYVESNLAPQLLRDARVFRVFEGPTETLTLFLGLRVLHQGNALHRFLCDDLGASAVSQALRDATARIEARWGDRRPGGGGVATSRWAAFLAGDVATYALLWAVAEHTAAGSPPTPRGSRAAAWARRRFEQRLAEAVAVDPASSPPLSASDADELVATYAEAIGDVEQAAPGEDRAVDPLLRRRAR